MLRNVSDCYDLVLNIQLIPEREFNLDLEFVFGLNHYYGLGPTFSHDNGLGLYLYGDFDLYLYVNLGFYLAIRYQLLS